MRENPCLSVALYILTRADFCAGTGLLNNNNNNNNNNMASPGPSGNKLSEILRTGSQPGSAQQYHDEMQSQQQRMAVMAAVSAGKREQINGDIIKSCLTTTSRAPIWRIDQACDARISEDCVITYQCEITREGKADSFVPIITDKT